VKPAPHHSSFSGMGWNCGRGKASKRGTGIKNGWRMQPATMEELESGRNELDAIQLGQKSFGWVPLLIGHIVFSHRAVFARLCVALGKKRFSWASVKAPRREFYRGVRSGRCLCSRGEATST